MIEGAKIANGWAHAGAERRLIEADGSIYAAFDALGLGFDHDDVLDYLAPACDGIALPEAHRGHVAGLVMGFALTVTEAARRTRDRRQEPEAICNRCGAPKGLQALGQSCNTNCGGRVVASA